MAEQTPNALSPAAFAAALAAADDFLILTHRRPDGDTVGAAAALCLGLRRMGKRAFLLENAEVSPKLAPYFVPYVRAASFAGRTVVTTDISAFSQLPADARAFADRIDFLIDHHQNNDLPARHRLIDMAAAATAEMVFALLAHLGVALDAEIATPLYIGIATDTGCFKYPNTRAETHRQAAACMEQGIPVARLNKRFFNTKRRARIEMERLVYQNLRFMLEDRVAAISISRAMREITGATEDDLDDLSAFPPQIEGVLAGITCYELADGSLKLSLRTTTDSLNAAAICAVFGGGGHARAAGCTMTGVSADAAIGRVAEAVEAALEASA